MTFYCHNKKQLKVVYLFAQARKIFFTKGGLGLYTTFMFFISFGFISLSTQLSFFLDGIVRIALEARWLTRTSRDVLLKRSAAGWHWYEVTVPLLQKLDRITQSVCYTRTLCDHRTATEHSEWINSFGPQVVKRLVLLEGSRVIRRT